MPANHGTVQAWCEFAATQWRVGGMGGRIGLDYAAVQPLLVAHWPRAWKRLFAGVRVIERALLGVDAERTGGTHEHAH